MTRLAKPFERELEISRSLQHAVRNHIERQHMTNDQVAEKLGLLPVGAQRLLNRSNEWSLETSVRTALALGLDVRVETK